MDKALIGKALSCVRRAQGLLGIDPVNEHSIKLISDALVESASSLIAFVEGVEREKEDASGCQGQKEETKGELP